ncbi:flippase [Flammeovirga pectinis]|uniref:Flippase n=1 Tax=Flammeovirga pectinis TaxID=2494373 RepID=A0A3S9P252_9BACT|nr:flippase [Flammeovirga pectinis]AZQ62235.1 flippase [Flammeovirga pectinis]
MGIKETFINWYKKDGVKSILKNINWLVLDRIIRMVGGLLINAWVSRYLGPSKMGIWDISISVSSLFLIFSSFGLDRLAIRNFVNSDRETTNTNLSVLFTMRASAALISFLTSGLILQYLADGSQERIIVGWMISSSILVQVFDIFTFKLQADLLSKYTVIAKGCGFIISSILKVICITENLSLEYFVATYLVDFIIGFLLLSIIFIKKYSFIKFKFSSTVFKDYWTSFFPLLLSSLAFIIYSKIDQIMIDRMIDETAVGVYTRAVKLNDIAIAIYTIMSSSLFPELTKQYNKSIKDLNKSYERICSLLSGLSYLGVIATIFLSDFVIDLLYGPSYSGAANNLKILIVGMIFLYNGGMKGNYLILLNKKKIITITSFASIFINVGMNALLIPKYGANGAAIASVFTLCFINFLINFLFKDTREVGRIQFRSFFLVHFIKKYIL